MTDKNKTTTKTSKKVEKDTSQPMQSLPLQIHAQYIRDVSFESPNAPESLRAGQESPEMDISFNMDARNVEDSNVDALYEVILKVSANATRGESTVFIAEVEYGAVVELSKVPEDKHHPLLLIEVPRLLFPFVRQVLSDLTQGGGYPPMNLNPVDFSQIYLQRFAKKDGEPKATVKKETKKSA